MNSGIIEIEAALNVYLVNKILCPASNVNINNKVLIAKDFPEPLPPVTIKYLDLELSKTLYLLLKLNCTY